MIISATSFGQKLYIGALYSSNSTWLLNSHVTKSDDQTYKFSSGYNAGVSFTYKLINKVGIEADILFSKTLQKYELDIISTNTSVAETQLNSIDIPVLLKVGNHVFFEVGPVISFKTKAEYTFEELSAIDVSDNFKSTDIGGVLGFGGGFGIAKKLRVNLGTRITAYPMQENGIDALSNSIKDLNKLTSDTYKTINLSAGIYLGVKFNL